MERQEIPEGNCPIERVDSATTLVENVARGFREAGFSVTQVGQRYEVSSRNRPDGETADIIAGAKRADLIKTITPTEALIEQMVKYHVEHYNRRNSSE